MLPGMAMSSGTATSFGIATSGSTTWERSPKTFRNRRREDSKWIEGPVLAKEIAAVKKKIGALALRRRRRTRRGVGRRDDLHDGSVVNLTTSDARAGRCCALPPGGVSEHMRLADLNHPANFLIVE